MKFSILSLITAISLFAWCMALYNTPPFHRGTFVAVSFIVILCLMFLIAMTSSISKDGKMESEKNWLLQALEPTFKTAGYSFIFVVVVVVLLVLAATVLMAGKLLTGT